MNRSKNVVILKLADCMNHGAATAGISNCCDLNVELGSRFGVKRGTGRGQRQVQLCCGVEGGGEVINRIDNTPVAFIS